MARNNHIQAPNEDSLRNIEQVADRSELSTLYYRARNEWNDKEILSEEQREAKRTAEHIQTARAAKNKFVQIGILLPFPIITLAILVSLALTFINFTAPMMEVPFIIIMGGIWATVSYHAMKKAFNILYSHTIGSVPFFLIFMMYFGLSTQAVFLLSRDYHFEALVPTILMLGGSMWLVSIVLSAALLIIWTSQKLSAQSRLVVLGLVALTLLGGVIFAMLI